jgi:hypothetical protein
MLTIKKIFDATILYYSKDYIQRTYQERIGKEESLYINNFQDRRKYMNDLEKYVEVVMKQLDEFDSAVDSAQMEILTELGLNLETFSSSIEYYFTQGNQDIYIMTTVIPQKLKYYKPSNDLND